MIQLYLTAGQTEFNEIWEEFVQGRIEQAFKVIQDKVDTILRVQQGHAHTHHMKTQILKPGKNKSEFFSLFACLFFMRH
jgi:hypothetical protein